MITAIDNFFYMGSSHQVCDDFSHFVEINKDLIVGIVSDGCSSSHLSSIGSRLLTTAIFEQFNTFSSWFEKEKEEYYFDDVLLDTIMREAFLNVEKYKDFYLDAFLDTTILLSITYKDKTIVRVYGDGVIIYEDKENIKHSIVIDYNNMPQYYSYYIDKNRQNLYNNNIKNYSIFYDKLEKVCPIEFKSGINFTFEHSSFNKLILMTDGVLSFNNSENINIDVMYEMLDIKNIAGSFLQRRAISLMKKYSKLGFVNNDDFSGLAIVTKQQEV